MGVMVEDEELVAFYRAEHPRLVRALSLLAEDLGVAEELAQEALLRAGARWAHVRRFDRPGAWTRRVALNLARSRWRRHQAERRAVARHGPPAATSEPDLALHLSVHEALAKLPVRQREVLVLRHLLGLSVAETALELRASEASVKAHTRRGAAALRAHLDPTPELAREERTDG